MRREKQKNVETRYLGLPRQGVGILLAMIFFSLLIHLGSYINLEHLSYSPRNPFAFEKKNTVRIKVNPVPTTPEAQKIVEVEQQETERPDIPRFRGSKNHKTEKETKVAANKVRPKAADPGDLMTAVGKQPQKKAASGSKQPKQRPDQKLSITSPNGTQEIGVKRPKPRNQYENLIPTNSELAGMMRAGYQDYIADKMAEGDRIDINTSDYRFIGYFTLMRKSIESVWNYPSDAVRRGLQGAVGLEFTIFKDGSVRSVKVIQSSGYDILDRAIVDAIKLAAPFSPLPNDMQKNKLTITGTFSYVLVANYAGG